jgi:hypothetical protein
VQCAEGKKGKKEAEDQRSQLADALRAQATALLDLFDLANKGNGSAAPEAALGAVPQTSPTAPVRGVGAAGKGAGPNAGASVGGEDEAALSSAVAELRKWGGDTGSEVAYLPLHARLELRANRWAGAGG